MSVCSDVMAITAKVLQQYFVSPLSVHGIKSECFNVILHGIARHVLSRG